ncbi:MAG TPA: helix-turn-helix transcriptional regulator [Ktedonobacteraceae bacterium]
MIRLRLREVAEAKGMSRTKLSRLADINYKTVNRLWKDPYREFTSTSLSQLARALGVPVTDLIEEVPDDAAREEMEAIKKGSQANEA